jgi:hypothetical protein
MERTKVGGVVGLIRRNIVPIHHKPQFPTLILISHVPIVMHMGMMLIIVSHFTQNYGKANHRIPMLIRAKVLGRTKREKVQPTKGQPPSQLKANPTPWRLSLHGWRP